MTVLLFAHGWGFDRHVWAGVRRLLTLNNMTFSNIDSSSPDLIRGSRADAGCFLSGDPRIKSGDDECVEGDNTCDEGDDACSKDDDAYIKGGDGRVELAFIDLGYFGDPLIPEIDPEHSVIAIGHSFGAAWLLRFCAVQSLRLKGFIAINGFPRFTDAPDYAPATPFRLVERMRKCFTDDPQTVLADFRHRCGMTGAPSLTPDTIRLAGGLERLASWDLRSELRALDCRVLSLAGENDRIVPPAMAAHAFDGARDLRLAWHPAAGHVLPIEAPKWCAGQIQSFLAAL